MLAIENKKDDIVKYLIDTFLDIDIEKRDIQSGNTMLHYACINNNHE
jgi:ankyrin repeat protein